MKSVISIVSADFSTYLNNFIMHVDVIYPDDLSKNRTYIILVPASKLKTLSEDEFKSFVEYEIMNQQKKAPDYSGLSWRSNNM